jgi:hypothetical protein
MGESDESCTLRGLIHIPVVGMVFYLEKKERSHILISFFLELIEAEGGRKEGYATASRVVLINSSIQNALKRHFHRGSPV